MGDWYKNQHDLKTDQDPLKFFYFFVKNPYLTPLKKTHQIYTKLKNCLDLCQKKLNPSKYWTLISPMCLMVFQRHFQQYFSYIVAVFCWWKKPENPEKTTDLLQVTDKLYHIMLYTSPWSRFKLTTSVVIGTDCIGNCKPNNHTITTTTAPLFYTLSEINKQNEIRKGLFNMKLPNSP